MCIVVLFLQMVNLDKDSEIGNPVCYGQNWQGMSVRDIQEKCKGLSSLILLLKTVFPLSMVLFVPPLYVCNGRIAKQEHSESSRLANKIYLSQLYNGPVSKFVKRLLVAQIF